MDDAALADLIRERVLVGGSASGTGLAGIHDFFDLADALQDPASIQRALASLDRGTLAVLAALGDAASRRAAGTAARGRAGAPGTADTTDERGIALADVSDVLRAWAPHRSFPAEAVRSALSRSADRLLAERRGGGFAIYPPVAAQLASWPLTGLPSGTQLAAASAPAALAVVPGTEPRFTDRLASEHAFTAVSHVAHVILEFGREPARELQRGGLALPDTKRIAAALAVELAEVASVVSIAARAGLIALDGSVWLPTSDGVRWSSMATPERWGVLASSWVQALPADVRSLLSARAHAEWGESLREYVTWAHPAGGESTLQRVSGFVEDAERLGITANDAPSRAGSFLLGSGRDAEDSGRDAGGDADRTGHDAARARADAAALARAVAAIAEHFPAEIDKVYLQNDLTVVSAGPLDPAVDSRIRRIADQESGGLAATYRFSPQSLNRAIAEGDDADSIRRFLEEVSVTGIPQPVDYLITEASERYGRVRVAPGGPGDYGSVVRSSDAALLHTIEVDKALAPLGLRRLGPLPDDSPGPHDRPGASAGAEPPISAHSLVSRLGRDQVYWALSEARYPVAAENAAGEVVSLQRERVAGEAQRGRSPDARAAAQPDIAADAVARLRESSEGDDAQAAWISRQLDIAIRGHIAVTVSVRMPDGLLTDYLLEPTGSGGGRLRGRDRHADLERTLPLSRIESIEVADGLDSFDNV
jgi:hypothetical protein